jgi:hypothetical protein
MNNGENIVHIILKDNIYDRTNISDYLIKTPHSKGSLTLFII